MGLVACDQFGNALLGWVNTASTADKDAFIHGLGIVLQHLQGCDGIEHAVGDKVPSCAEMQAAINNSIQATCTIKSIDLTADHKLHFVCITDDAIDVDLTPLMAEKDQLVKALAVSADGKLSLTMMDDSVKEVGLTRIPSDFDIVSGKVDGDFLELEKRNPAETPIRVDLSAFKNLPDIYVNQAAYDGTAKKLVLTRTDGQTVDVDLSALIDDSNTTVKALEVTPQGKLILTMMDNSTKEADLTRIPSDFDIVSGKIDGDFLELDKRNPAETPIRIDLSSVASGNDTYVDGATFDSNTGKLELTRTDGQKVAVTLNFSKGDSDITGGRVEGTNLILEHRDGTTLTISLASLIPFDKYVTDATLTTAGNLKLTLSDGTVKDVDFNPLVTNIDIVSGTLQGDKLEFVRKDGSKIDVSLAGLSPSNPPDVYVTGAEFNPDTRVMTLTRSDGGKVTATLPDNAGDIISGAVNGSNLELGKQDGSKLIIDLSSLNGGTDTYVDGVQLNGTTLDLSRNDRVHLSANLYDLQPKNAVIGMDFDGINLTLHTPNGTFDLSTSLSNLLPGSGVYVSGITFNDASESLYVTYSDGSNASVSLQKLFTDYDIQDLALNGTDLVLTRNDGHTFTVSLSNLIPTDVHLTSSALDNDEHTLHHTMSDGNVIDADLKGLKTSNSIKDAKVENGKLVIDKEDGSKITVDLPVQNDVYLNNAALSSASNLKLTMNNGVDHDVDLSGLVTGNDVKDATLAGNILSINRNNGTKADVDLSGVVGSGGGIGTGQSWLHNPARMTNTIYTNDTQQPIVIVAYPRTGTSVPAAPIHLLIGTYADVTNSTGIFGYISAGMPVSLDSSITAIVQPGEYYKFAHQSSIAISATGGGIIAAYYLHELRTTGTGS